MDFRLLGPVQVWHSGSLVNAGPARQLNVLAALAVDTGRPVSIESLIDRVWDAAPPASARHVLYSYVARLRRVFAAHGGGAAIVRHSGGYQLDAEPGQVDVHRFRALLDQAREPSLPDVEQARLVGQALSLWQGVPLSNLKGAWANEVREVWNLQRIEAARWWAEAQLRLSQPEMAIGTISALVVEYPMVESLVDVLMRNLAAAGRGAEALEQFAALRMRLADELGADPSPDLQAAHQAILRGSQGQVARGPSSPRLAEATGVGSGRTMAPAQLPMDVRGFVGRSMDLGRLDLAAADAAAGRSLGLTVLTGTPGIGKTALAVRWAHRVRQQFPDGQLYVNLRGFDGSDAPMETTEAVRLLLDALCVPPEQVPPEPASAIALYRTLAADRRLLILLDNAVDAAQVRPLLPGAGGCVVLVTSRSQLAGLVAAEGAHLVTVDLLSPDEARRMLARRLGAGRTDAEPAAVDEIAARCARLPLALALVAARAAANPDFPLSRLADELRADHLDVLGSGDPATDVRNVFSWSYDRLSPPAARMFRLLGLHPPPDIGALAAASLSGLSAKETRTTLAELTRVHLVAEHSPGRYTLHDLLRAYARELTAARDTDAERSTAIHRVLDHYAHSGEAAATRVDSHLEPLVRTPAQPGVTIAHFDGHEQALDWVTGHRRVLLAVIRLAVDTGFDQHAWQLSRIFAGLLHNLGWWQDLIAMEQLAIEVTGRLGEHAERAWAHRLLGRAYASLHHYREAEAAYLRATSIYEDLGDAVGQAAVHFAIACLSESTDREAMRKHSAESLRLYTEAGQRLGQGRALNLVGWVHALHNEFEEGLRHCRRALTLQQEIDDRVGEAATWDSIGYIRHHREQFQQAVDCYHQALALYRRSRDRYNEADVLTHLGDTHHAAGDMTAARTAWQLAEQILADLADPAAETMRARLAQLDTHHVSAADV